MLTASNKTTKHAQELLATAPGGLLVSQEECRCYRVTESAVLPTGPCRLVGAVIVPGMEISTVTIDCGTDTALKLISVPGSTQSAFMPLPLACSTDLTVSLQGVEAEAYVFVADAL